MGWEILSISHLQESELYQFLCNLKSSGRGATVGKQVLRSTFHMADADKQQLSGLMTTRVKGVADSMMASKPQLKQATPLTTDIVFGLANLMFCLREVHHAVICGPSFVDIFCSAYTAVHVLGTQCFSVTSKSTTMETCG